MPAVDVSYRIEGEGPPVYFAHGIGSRKTGWDAVIAGLSDRFTCVAYDQRGHGESPVPPVPYSLDELVDDLEALRERLGHDRIHVVGHSLGGQIGPAYARAFPERVASVALLSTAAFRTDEDSAKVKAVVAAIRERGAADILPTLVDRWFTERFATEHPEAIDARLAQVLETPEPVFTAVFDVYAGTEMGAWLRQVRVPCLVLTGEEDGGCNPRLNRLIDAALPDSELVVLPGLRHSILIEAPDLVASHLRAFLERVAGQLRRPFERRGVREWSESRRTLSRRAVNPCVEARSRHPCQEAVARASADSRPVSVGSLRRAAGIGFGAVGGACPRSAGVGPTVVERSHDSP